MSNMSCKSYGKITLISISYYIIIILGAPAILNEKTQKKDGLLMARLRYIILDNSRHENFPSQDYNPDQNIWDKR